MCNRGMLEMRQMMTMPRHSITKTAKQGVRTRNQAPKKERRTRVKTRQGSLAAQGTKLGSVPHECRPLSFLQMFANLATDANSSMTFGNICHSTSERT